VHDGGYNVTSEILSFLSPAHLPVQITPTRWKRDPESLILFMRARFQENNAAKDAIINAQRARFEENNAAKDAAMEAVVAINDRQRVEIEELRQRIAELEANDPSRKS